MTTEQKIQYIADHYGYEPQSRQLIEELSELIQAVCKHHRAYEDRPISVSCDCPERDSIAEEMADVCIMIWQLCHLLGISNERINQISEKKLDRQIERIKNEIH